MAISDYISPENRFSQGDIISLIGDKSLAGGICRMLSTQWVVQCTEKSAPSPDSVLNIMRNMGTVYFKQIGQNFKAYADVYVKDGWIGSIIDCLRLSSRQRLDGLVTAKNLQLGTDVDALLRNIHWACELSTTEPNSAMISFSCPAGNHSIAIAEEQSDMGSTYYVFDPNFGILKIDSSLFGPGQTLKQAIAEIWNYYNIKTARVSPVVKKR